MARQEIRAEERINAAPNRVYSILSDPTKTALWLPHVLTVLPTNRKSGVGATRTVTLRVGNTRVESHQRIVVAEKGKAFGWIHDADFLDDERFEFLTDVGTQFDLEPLGKNATRLRATAHFEPVGLRASLAAPLFLQDAKNQIRIALENLKRVAEADDAKGASG
jgi:uncharacterized protein YndB with AHSA1/START domain